MKIFKVYCMVSVSARKRLHTVFCLRKRLLQYLSKRLPENIILLLQPFSICVKKISFPVKHRPAGVLGNDAVYKAAVIYDIPENCGIPLLLPQADDFLIHGFPRLLPAAFISQKPGKYRMKDLDLFQNSVLKNMIRVCFFIWKRR